MKLKYVLAALLSLSYTASVRSQVTLNSVPSRLLGHAPNPVVPFEGLAPSNFNPNLVEGRELYAPAGLALDTSASPPILYVSDSGNNRVLAWKNGASFGNGAPADRISRSMVGKAHAVWRGTARAGTGALASEDTKE